MPYVNEYYYAATPAYWTYPGYNSDATKDYRASVGNNWMNINEYYWTLSRVSDYSDRAFHVYPAGCVYNGNVFGNNRIRPVFNLVSSVKTSGGSGTESDPYRIL